MVGKTVVLTAAAKKINFFSISPLAKKKDTKMQGQQKLQQKKLPEPNHFKRSRSRIVLWPQATCSSRYEIFLFCFIKHFTTVFCQQYFLEFVQNIAK
jgi:hypothetical protein